MAVSDDSDSFVTASLESVFDAARDEELRPKIAAIRALEDVLRTGGEALSRIFPEVFRILPSLLEDSQLSVRHQAHSLSSAIENISGEKVSSYLA